MTSPDENEKTGNSTDSDDGAAQMGVDDRIDELVVEEYARTLETLQRFENADNQINESIASTFNSYAQLAEHRAGELFGLDPTPRDRFLAENIVQPAIDRLGPLAIDLLSLFNDLTALETSLPPDDDLEEDLLDDSLSLSGDSGEDDLTGGRNGKRSRRRSRSRTTDRRRDPLGTASDMISTEKDYMKDRIDSAGKRAQKRRRRRRS